MKAILRCFRVILLTIFLCFITGQLIPAAAKEEQDGVKLVLILNSYHQEMLWTQEETRGMVDSFTDSGMNINYAIENMDWKNYPTQTNLDFLFQYFKYKYENRKIDLILTSDDAALKFALEHRKELFSDAPVVFAGVNQEGISSITEGYDNLTGIVEVIDPTQTLALAIHINPKLKNIYLLYDNTESGLSTGALVRDKAAKLYPEINIIPMNNMAFDEVVNTVQKLDKDSVVLMTTYSSDGDQKIIDINYAIREVCQNSSVPVYHLYNFGFENGATGGVMLDGTKEGQSAGALAIQILEGEKPDSISFLLPEATRSAMNYEQMERYGITEKNIPESFEIVGRPFSFYETYRALIITVLGIITALVLIISILLYYIRKIRRMRKELAANHEELTQLYEELTASDEELKQQFDEILDINEKIKIGEEKMTHLAYNDSLTGLPNKLSLIENSEDIFISEKNQAALLFIDVDNFKNINDTLGHDFGDQLIIKVGESLSSLFGKEKCIYRLGGDEFVILLNNRNGDGAREAAVSILKEFTRSLKVGNHKLRISVSIGIAMFPEHGTSLEQLLKYADIAMYRVKESGKTNYMLYSSLMNEQFTERVNIEKHLSKALKNKEFELYYQPQYDLEQKRITGFEALLRWHSPELGEVSPLKFIRVAEDNHFIIPLGNWVLCRACEFLYRLKDMGFGELKVSVNISIVQLIQEDFCENVAKTVREAEIDGDNLELEITETVLIESIDRINDKLNQLHELNIRFVLDDFGKGYSSFNYLRQLPIKTLKVDKAFIDGILVEGQNLLAGQIVAFGKNMGMTVVAEGVETKEQWDYLVQHRCDKIQGYIFSKPKPEEEIIKLLLEE